MKEKQQTTETKTKLAAAKTTAETKEQTNKQRDKKKESKNILISNLQVRDVLEVDFTEFA